MNQEKEIFQLKNWELVSVNPNNRNWIWSDYFNYWAVSIQSVIGFSLITSFYLLYDLNSIIVFSGCLIATFLIFIFTNIIGKTSLVNFRPFIVPLLYSFSRFIDVLLVSLMTDLLVRFSRANISIFYYPRSLIFKILNKSKTLRNLVLNIMTNGLNSKYF